MSTCCPNCPATALGTETASLCTECATATVAGASFNLPLLIAGALAAGVAIFTYRMLHSRVAEWIRTRQPAQA